MAAGSLTVACGDPTPPASERAETPYRLWIRTTGLVVNGGDTVRVGAILADSAVTTYHEFPGSLSNPWPAGIRLRWWTSDPAIASIDTGSLLAAQRPGRVVVWVAVGAVEDSGTVVVGAESGGSPVAHRGIGGGLFHTCAVDHAGGTRCWGSDFGGALGRGYLRNFTSAALPGPVASEVTFRALAVGGGHACGLTVGGAAYCWGGNQYGELGDGTDGSAFSETGGFGRPVPVAVLGGRTFAAVAAGGFHTCALDENGQAFCWGWHGLGQLGVAPVQSPSDHRVTPTPVAGGLHFRRVGLAALHSCGITTDSVTYCWGRNDRGQLGIDTAATPAACGGGWRCAATPVVVNTPYRFSEVVGGSLHTCGLTAAGAAICWGDGSPVPTPVGGPPFVTLVAGAHHTCGLTAAGAAYCWGTNDDGQLGIGTVGGSEPSPRAVNTTVAFAALGAGVVHTCGIDAAGRAYCWGRNGHGRIGNGTVQAPNAVFRATVPTPVPVLHPLP